MRQGRSKLAVTLFSKKKIIAANVSFAAIFLLSLFVFYKFRRLRILFKLQQFVAHRAFISVTVIVHTERCATVGTVDHIRFQFHWLLRRSFLVFHSVSILFVFVFDGPRKTPLRFYIVHPFVAFVKFFRYLLRFIKQEAATA